MTINSTSINHQEITPSYDGFPDEIWLLIFNRLESDDDDHHYHFESLSLVSKRFLSLTNRFRRRFVIVDQAFLVHGTISSFIRRFDHLKTLDLSRLRYSNLEIALREIANTSVALNLEVLDISNQDRVPVRSLKKLGESSEKLRVLKCSNVVNLRDKDVIGIAKSLPDLEELDISNPRHQFTSYQFPNANLDKFVVSDAGIEVLASNLKHLVKIDISRNYFLTDKSILALSLNCVCLREMAFVDCSFVTPNGVRCLLRNNTHLRSIALSIVQTRCEDSSLFMDCAISARGLCSIDLTKSEISDELLRSIAKAHFLLKRISLSCCVCYTIDGISDLLYAYQSLEFLDLTKSNFLNDEAWNGLSKYLHDLVSIKLNFCSKLTSKTFFTLINNCPFLEDVEMKNTNLGKEDNPVVDVVNNRNPHSKIKSLNLARNVHLTDECLVKITSVCPNLKRLDVSSCPGITEGLGEVLRSCSEIRCLSVNECGKVKNIGLNMKPFLKLENLYMARSGLNDEGLLEIGKRCNGLVKIDVAGCLNVTTDAVKDLVRSCEKLREIQLKGCLNVDELIVDCMMFTTPSSKKIIPPSFTATTISQRELLLRHGCYVCEN